MRTRKPIGWPAYMVAKRLATGQEAYYWGAPTWARKAGCTIGSIPLGSDYGIAKARCDAVLNPQFAAWRGKDESAAAVGPQPGSFDWMVATYKTTTRFTSLPEDTRHDYDRSLRLVSDLPARDGSRRFGDVALASISPAVADRIYERVKLRPGGGTRGRTAVLCMVCCKLAWNAARRARSEIPAENPFSGMRLKHTAKLTRAVTHDELVRFVAAADACGDASIGTAAMIAFYWLQRQIDILQRLSWSHYRPDGMPVAMVRHHKTGEEVRLPLYDDDGSMLWPELMTRLEATERRGTLIVTRDTPDRRRKIYLPWEEDYFRHRVADIRKIAGIDTAVKFMGLRHGGNTEGADADLTDAQMRALSGHRSSSLLIYARETMKQRREGARKRRDARNTPPQT